MEVFFHPANTRNQRSICLNGEGETLQQLLSAIAMANYEQYLQPDQLHQTAEMLVPADAERFVHSGLCLMMYSHAGVICPIFVIGRVSGDYGTLDFWVPQNVSINVLLERAAYSLERMTRKECKVEPASDGDQPDT